MDRKNLTREQAVFLALTEAVDVAHPGMKDTQYRMRNGSSEFRYLYGDDRTEWEALPRVNSFLMCDLKGITVSGADGWYVVENEPEADPLDVLLPALLEAAKRHNKAMGHDAFDELDERYVRKEKP